MNGFKDTFHVKYRELLAFDGANFVQALLEVDVTHVFIGAAFVVAIVMFVAAFLEFFMW